MKVQFPTLVLLVMTIISCSTSDIEEEAFLNEELGPQTEVGHTVSEFENQVLQAINQYRTSIGLNALANSSAAYPFADEHTYYMIQKKKLSHDNFNTRASNIAAACNAKAVAENVARNYRSAQEVVEGWLESNAHKNTIEGDFTHSAVAIGEDENGNPYFTHIFFKR